MTALPINCISWKRWARGLVIPYKDCIKALRHNTQCSNKIGIDSNAKNTNNSEKTEIFQQ